MATKVKSKKSAPAVRRGRTMRSRLSVKNQLTVPVEVMREAGLVAGDEIRFVLKDGVVIIQKDVPAIFGLIGAGGDIYKDYDFAKDREDAWAR